MLSVKGRFLLYSKVWVDKNLNIENIKIKPIAKERVYYLDILRILAIIAVILAHSAATEVARVQNIGSLHWWVANVFDSISRWSVPVFFMISGALLLGSEKEETIKDFFKKKIVRLLIPFMIWSSVYSLLNHYLINPDYPSALNMVKIIVTEFLLDKAYIHFWFMYVIIGIYMVVPIIKNSITALKRNELLFCIGIWFAISVLYRYVRYLIAKNFGVTVYVPILDIPFFTGYLGYVLVGYYLNKYSLKKITRIIIYVLGSISLIATPIVTYFISLGKEALDETYYTNFSITTFFVSIAVFTLFKNIDWNNMINVKMKKLIASISKSVFGIYFIHLIVQVLVLKVTFNYVMYDNVFIVGVYIANALMNLILSYIIIKLVGLNNRLGKILFG